MIPEQGSQVWAVLSIDSIFETYTIQSAAANNAINLRCPLAHLQRALRSALTASSASLRLTKKDNVPLLSLTITTNTLSSRAPAIITTAYTAEHPPTGNPDNASYNNGDNDDSFSFPDHEARMEDFHYSSHDRETTITQSIPVVVLAPETVAQIHEPHCREPDVHIMLPPLLQLKAISERFTKLSLAPSSATTSALLSSKNSYPEPRTTTPSSASSRLTLAANMHGQLSLSISTPALRINSTWEGLHNPELDPGQVEGGEEGMRELASTRMKGVPKGEEAGWARVRVEGRDWGRVLGVGRLGGRVIACFCHEHALILYVYLTSGDPGSAEESVLTYYIASYSA